MILNGIIKENFAKKCYRTILTAYRDIPEKEFDALLESTDKLEEIDDKINIFAKDMTMVALYGLQDPLKKGVKDAIRVCYEAGITVRMVTGDNLDTATAIAIEANILDSNYY
jgi:Ca2+ transporting ATPase